MSTIQIVNMLLLSGTTFITVVFVGNVLSRRRATAAPVERRAWAGRPLSLTRSL